MRVEMKTVRITGLVRVADRVRQEMMQPLAPGRRRQLQDRVAASLRGVQQILDQHEVTIQSLPAPSRRAYQFLAGLKWDDVAVDDSASPPAARMSWPRLNTYLE